MTSPALASFGAGKLFATPILASGIAEPLEFAVLQDVSLDFGYTVKPLHGSKQHPIFVARAEGKFVGKAKFGIMSGDIISQLFFGIPAVPGQISEQTDLLQIPATPFTLTVVPPASGTFVADQGVKYVGGGDLVPVASGPTTGQYTVSNAGVYVFAAADTLLQVEINYTYSVAAAGQKVAITNDLMGTTPCFSMVLRERDPRNGLYNTVVFNRCTSDKFSLAHKYNDYAIPEFDFSVMDDGNGNIGTWSFGDKT